jgi:hypothetical protein
VIVELPDLRAICDERDQAHIPAKHRTRQRKDLVDASDQNCPEVVRLR